MNDQSIKHTINRPNDQPINYENNQSTNHPSNQIFQMYSPKRLYICVYNSFYACLNV